MSTIFKHKKIFLACSIILMTPHSKAEVDPDKKNRSNEENIVETILVTAEHKVTTIQDSALSITVKSGEELQQQGKYQLSDILEDIPGITGGAATQVGNTTGSGTDTPSAGLTIRGIPSNVAAGGSNISVAPAAALYVDGIYQGIGGTYDVQRVEVLRGPQGTLYGRSATSGLVAIHTNNPTFDGINGNVQLERGNYSTERYSGAINIPLVEDSLAIRIAANDYERNGFFSKEGGYRENKDYKAKLLYEPNENFSTLIGYAYSKNQINSGGVSISPDLTNYNKMIFDYNQDISSGGTPVNYGSNSTSQYWAEVNYDLNNLSLTYLFSRRNYDQELNSTYSANVILSGYATTPKSDFTTNEIRISSNNNEKLTWQIGLLHYKNELKSYNENYQVNSDGSETLAFISDVPNKETSALGIFGEATYEFSPTIRLTAGLRYDTTEVDATQTLITEDVTESLSSNKKYYNLNYKLRLEKNITDENMLYTSVSTGFTPGDISLNADNNASNPEDRIVVNEYEDKTMTSYEIGSKNSLLDKSMTWNIAAYYLDYEGYQVGDFEFSLGLGIPFSKLVTIPMKVKGIESETSYYISDSDRISFNLSYTDAKFVNTETMNYGPFTNPFFGSEYFVTFNDLHGTDEVHGVPKLTSSINYDHNYYFEDDSTLNIGIDVMFISEYLGGPIRNDLIEDGREEWLQAGDAVISNLNLTWLSSDSSYSISAYIRNLGNKLYYTKTGAYGKDGSAPSGLVLESSVNSPRTFGIVFNYFFE